MKRFLEADLPAVLKSQPNGLGDRNDLELASRMCHLNLMADHIDVQYILLVTAIENIIPNAKPLKDDPDVLAAADKSITYVKEPQRFSRDVRDKVLSSLRFAKEESIGNMGASSRSE